MYHPQRCFDCHRALAHPQSRVIRVSIGSRELDRETLAALVCKTVDEVPSTELCNAMKRGEEAHEQRYR